MSREIIVDNFAGGGGASTGIELATGRSVDIAINHDPEAIKMHKANHPSTEHYCESVWDVDPVKACRGRKVGLAWFSPDCKHFSKAKGGKPVEKKIRGLAWIVLKWAALVRPRVIMLENVEEFQTWGPLRKGRPLKARKGETYQKWRNQLEALGYKIETKELIAADYGAPTKRKRFFMVARCDGKTIVWPEPTHGPRESDAVKKGLIKPYVPAAEIIDWNIPCKSIFGRKRTLAENTMKRIARGLEKFVFNNPEPFIVQVNHSGENFRGQDIKEPMPTLTAKHGFGVVTPYITQIGQTGFAVDRSKDIEDPITTIVSKAEHCLITPTLIQYHSETTSDGVRGQEMQEPVMTIDGSNRYGLVSAFISKYYAGGYKGAGSEVEEPLPTVTAIDHNAICTAHIVKLKGTNIGQNIEEPLHTITAGGLHYGEVTASFISQMQGQSIGTDTREPLNTMTGVNHMAEVRAFLIKYYGQGIGQNIKEPLDTVVSKDHFGLVTIAGIDYQIIDIGLRMLEPHELYAAQGFPDDYIIDRDLDGKRITKTEQVKRCGNAVPPPFANALVRANLPELCTDKRKPNCRTDRLKVEETGQLRFA